MTDKIIFNINDKININILLPCAINELDCCSEVTIELENKQQRLLLFDHSDIRYALEPFKILLSEAIEGKCNLPESIKNYNIGYLWNEELHGSSILPIQEGTLFWVGEHHLLWESSAKLATWIYNKNDEIILEITPVYKLDQLDNKHASFFYDEWIKNYQPILNINIDKNIAKKLLKKTESILNTVEKNIKLQ